MSDDTLLAWGVYIAASLFLALAAFRITAGLKYGGLRMVLRVLAVCLLITPAQLDGSSSNWVPAFIAVLLDEVTIGSDAAIERLWPLLAAMLAALLVSLGWRYMRAGKQS